MFKENLLTGKKLRITTGIFNLLVLLYNITLYNKKPKTIVGWKKVGLALTSHVNVAIDQKKELVKSISFPH